MIYDGKDTHFYGKGTPDPLRKDPTLKNLKAKSARLEAIAAIQNCAIFNLSKRPNSNLIFRRISLNNICKDNSPRSLNSSLLKSALQKEKELGYFVEDGRYWKHFSEFNQEKIDSLDDLWNRVIDHY